MSSFSINKEMLENYERDGYCVIPNFLTENEVDELRSSMSQVAAESYLSDQKPIFTTYDDKRHVSDKYFVESIDKIRYFYEEGAFDAQGNMILPQERALNKVGHGLHVLHPVFRRITFSSKVVEVMKQIGFKDPVIPQSMYIFKQPGIGGVVNPHIDGTFLLCDPPTSVVGMWFPLENATLENGCLWFVPGSHKRNKVTRRFVRTNQLQPSESLVHYEGHMTPPENEKFIAVPAAKGSCVLIHSLVWHKSDANKSEKSRHAYTFHVFDQGSSKWDETAWLQPTDSYQFPCLYRDQVKTRTAT